MRVRLPAAFAHVQSVPLGQGAQARLLQRPRIQQRHACVDAEAGREWQLWECQRLGRACAEAEVPTTLLVSAIDGCFLPLLAACFAVSVQRCLLCESAHIAEESRSSAARSADPDEATSRDDDICLASLEQDEAAQMLRDVKLKQTQYIFHRMTGSDSKLLEAARSNAFGIAVQELFEITVAARTDQAVTASSGAFADSLQAGRELHLFMLAGQSNMAGRGRLDELPEASCLGPDGFPDDQSLRDSIFFHSPSNGWLPAREPLHIDVDLQKRERCGVGPGLAFACHYLRRRSMQAAPSKTVAGSSFDSSALNPYVGLLPTAVGGSSLSEWSAAFLDGGKGCYFDGCPNLLCCASRSLYDALDSLVGATKQARARAIFHAVLWYQGETDAMDKIAAETYASRFESFAVVLRRGVAALLRHFGVHINDSDTIPLVTVRVTSTATKITFLHEVREQQLIAGHTVPRCAVTDAEALLLGPDRLHLTSHAQLRLAERMEQVYAEFLVANASVISEPLANLHRQQAVFEEARLRAEADIATYFESAQPLSPLIGPVCCQEQWLAGGRRWQSFTYGEVQLPHFCSAIGAAKDILRAGRTGLLFVDLGCGAGKALCAAALELGGSSRVRGYELLANKVYEAEKIAQRLQEVANEQGYPLSMVEVVRQDFLSDAAMSEWRHADLLLACATCFDDATMHGIEAGIQMMREDAVCLLLDKELTCSGVRLAGSLVVPTSWGHGNLQVYIIDKTAV